jgi:ABC-type siderophore export system fused ATPase/permease subunit
VAKGEILFIIGANGSGKTTLGKLITGLYEPDRGKFRVNGRVVQPALMGEYFSAVFTPIHLFERLYSIDVEANKETAAKYLKVLNLENKVELKNNNYSTINLSGGQRKRLALLQCYLEDSPIFIFDEWAADQDPSYRNFFYRTLLPAMKSMGKIVIAITHDDHYFDVADKVLKMENGKLEDYYQAMLLANTRNI